MLSTSECMWWHLWLLVATIIFLQGSCSVPHSFQHFGPSNHFLRAGTCSRWLLWMWRWAGCDKTKKQWLSRTGSQDREQAYLETFFWTLDNCAHLGTIWADDNREELLPLRRTFKRLWFKGFLEERKTTQNCQLKPFSWAICSLITWPWKCSETTIESRCLSKAWLELNYWCSWETQPSKLTKWIASDIRNVKANIVTGTMGHELSDNNSINVFYQLSKAFIACKTFNSFSKLFAHITICHRLEPYFDW